MLYVLCWEKAAEVKTHTIYHVLFVKKKILNYSLIHHIADGEHEPKAAFTLPNSDLLTMTSDPYLISQPKVQHTDPETELPSLWNKTRQFANKNSPKLAQSLFFHNFFLMLRKASTWMDVIYQRYFFNDWHWQGNSKCKCTDLISDLCHVRVITWMRPE